MSVDIEMRIFMDIPRQVFPDAMVRW